MATLRSTNLNLRISPDVRQALKEAAELDHRSINNMIEYLIVQHCKNIGITIKKSANNEAE